MAKEKTIVTIKKSDIIETEDDKIEHFIDKKRKKQIILLSNLIEINTVNPPGNEKIAVDLIKKHLDKLKIEWKTYEKTKSRTNLVATIGNPDGKTIMIANHLDTVPAGEGWDTDPFKATIKDNILYGRGACDNKGQAVASLLVLEYLKNNEKNLKNRFLFIFAADEETGGSDGLKYLLAKKFIWADYAIIPDVSGSMKKITIAEKGIINLKITALGIQAHGSTPHKGESAIVNMSKLITKLDYYNFKCDIHPLLSKPTINFGTIDGGSAPNTVAAKCNCVVNIRYIPSQTPEGIINEIKNLAERFGKFEFEILRDIPPTEIDNDNILVTTIQKIANKFGLEPKPVGLSGATDAKSLVMNGIPAVGFDFSDEHVAHNANEYCNLDNLFKFCNVLICICLDLDKNKLI